MNGVFVMRVPYSLIVVRAYDVYNKKWLKKAQSQKSPDSRPGCDGQQVSTVPCHVTTCNKA